MTSVSLKNLTALSQSLNEASDLLSQQILQVEAVLNELKLGVSAWVVFSRGEVEISGHTMLETESIGYSKHQGRWGLLYCKEVPDMGDPAFCHIVPLRDSPRMERIAAVDELPKLVQALEARATEVTQVAKAKAAEVSAFAKVLKDSTK